MAKIGHGYGSEFHLLRFLGRHRNYLDSEVLKTFGYSGKEVKWLDFKFDENQFVQDREYIGIEFLENETNFQQLKLSWRSFWPSANNAQNWDAIARVDDEWILVEAKAQKNEIHSSTTASKNSRLVISNSFDKVKNGYGIVTKNDWCENYYQKANRILFLDFMAKNNLNAKLLFIYFLNGYKKSGSQLGVTSKAEWTNLIKQQDHYLGITNNQYLKANIKNLILDTA